VKIGILEAENLKPELVEKFGGYSDMTQRLLSTIEPQLMFETHAVINGEYPQDINQCDAWLVTGSKASAYDEADWIRQLALFIQKLAGQQKKLIGICFGHQLIAQALGGKVEKSNKGWGVGIMTSDVVCHKAWMQPMRQAFALLVSHQDQVVELPPQAERIAGNDFCINSSYQINKHILCFQGHPEFSVAYARQSMDGRRSLLGEDTYRQAQASLNKPIDEQLIAAWILNFIQAR